MTAARIEGRLRRMLLVLAGLVFTATLVELVLEEHTKETLQFVPFVLCVVGLLAVISALARPGARTLLALRWTMVVVALGGMFGAFIHLRGNLLFEQEIRPNAETGELIVAMLKGAAPLLAPGILMFGALIALAATYYHPSLGKRGTP